MNTFWILLGTGLLIFLSLSGLALTISAAKRTDTTANMFSDSWMDEPDPAVAGKKLATQRKKK